MGTNLNISSLNLFAYSANNPVNRYDADGNFNWKKAFSGVSLVSIGVAACVAAATVVTGGACVPLMIAAGATFAAGGITIANGTSELVESATGYNVVRDGVYNGDTAYYETQKAVFATAAEIGTFAVGAMNTSGHGVCFIAGTTVLAAQGLIPIESIKTGDYVWAWNEDTGETELKQVVETYINETDELTHVFVNGEEIISTPRHPFYSPVKGWTDACKLRAGDILVLVNGEYVVIEKVQHEILESPVKVYNFQVEDDHTYYVSDTGVLVHNKCSGADPHRSSSWRTQKRNYWKSNSQTPSDLYDLSDANVALMRKGRAPIGYDGYRIELHHVEGIRNSSVIRPISHTSHVILHKYVGYKNMIKYSFN